MPKKLTRFVVALLLGLSFGLPGLGQQTPLQEGAYLLEQQRFAEAAERFERALAFDSTLTQAHRGVATAHLRGHRYAEALFSAERGLRFAPSDPFLHQAAGEALLLLGEHSRALTHYSRLRGRAISGMDTSVVRRRLGHLHELLGGAAFQEGDVQQARHHFREALELLPDAAGLYRSLGYLQVQEREWTEAIEILERGLRRFPEDDQLLQLKGAALYGLEQFDEVVQVYGRLAERHPTDVEIGLMHAQALLLAQERRAAVRKLESLREAFPDNRDIHEALVAVHEQALDFHGAIEALGAYRKRHPETELSARTARAHLALREWGAARSIYDSLRAEHPDGPWRLEWARTWVVQGDTARALQAVDSLLEETPRDPATLQEAVRLAWRLERWPEVVRYTGALIAEQSDPGPDLLAARADALLRAGEETGALQVSQDVLSHPRAVWVRIRAGASDARVACAAAGDALDSALRNLEEEGERRARMATERLRNPDTGRHSSELFTIEDREALVAGLISGVSEVCTASARQMVFTDLLARYPASGRLRYLVGREYERDDDRSAALASYRAAVRLAPTLDPAHRRMGGLLLRMGRPEEARQAYWRWLGRAPDDPAPYRALIRLHREQGELDTLIDRWRVQLRIAPGKRMLRQALIEALHKAGRTDEASAVAADGLK